MLIDDTIVLLLLAALRASGSAALSMTVIGCC